MTITDFQWIHLGSPGAYLLENDGTDSTFHYSASFPDAGATWTSTAVTGLWQKIRACATAGNVYLYSPGITTGACSTLTYDLTTDAMTGWGSAIALTYVPLATWRNSSHWNDPAASASYTRQGGTGAWLTSGYASTQQGFVGGFDLGQECVVDTIAITTNGGASQASRVVIMYLFNAAGTQVGHAFLDATGGGVINDSQAFNVTAQYVIIGMYAQNQMTATDLEITFAATSDAKTKYSTDFGDTFAAEVTVGTSPGAFGGVDTSKSGTVILAAADGQIMKASAGGAFAAYGIAVPTDFVPAAIWIPAKQLTTSSTANNATNPEFIVASSVEDATGATVYRVTAAGNTWTDISPDFGGVGLAVSADCLAMAHRSGKRISAVLDFSGSTKLVTSIDTGGAWLNRDTIVGALSVRYRRNDTSLQQLYISSSGGLVISQNHGALLQTRLSPGVTPLLGGEPFN